MNGFAPYQPDVAPHEHSNGFAPYDAVANGSAPLAPASQRVTPYDTATNGAAAPEDDGLPRRRGDEVPAEPPRAAPAAPAAARVGPRLQLDAELEAMRASETTAAVTAPTTGLPRRDPGAN